jgi:translation initiation factor 1
MSGNKVDLGGDGKPLTDNPFAKLQGLRDELPAGKSDPATAMPEADAPIRGPMPYSVAESRKGGLPISIENRPGNRIVTVIRNVSGDAEALLSMLKRRCGAGGALRGGAIEIQGDHRSTIESLLGGRGIRG